MAAKKGPPHRTHPSIASFSSPFNVIVRHMRLFVFFDFRTNASEKFAGFVQNKISRRRHKIKDSISLVKKN
jgi:hypothetical protein